MPQAIKPKGKPTVSGALIPISMIWHFRYGLALLLLLSPTILPAQLPAQSPADAGAQKPSTETLQLGWGAGVLARQDLLLSPMSTLNGSLFNFTTRFTREKKSTFRAELSLSMFRPARFDSYSFWMDQGGDTFETEKHYFTQAELRLSRELLRKPIREKIYWGLDAGFTGTVQAYSFLTARFGTFNYTALFSAEPVIWAEAASDKGKRLRASLSLPLISWVARSPYLLNDDEFIQNISSHSGFSTFFAYLGDGSLRTFNSLQRATLGLQATMPLSERWSLSADYRLDFLHLSKPAPLFSYFHTLHLVAGFQF